MNRRLRIACCSPIAAHGWQWISSRLDPSRFDWRFFNTAPRTLLERAVRRPDIARLRGCRELARCVAREDIDLMVTHSPLITCWSDLFTRRRRLQARHGRSKVPHLAFAFNFTHLPRGVRRGLMRRAFATVDRFVVFSRFERTLYHDHFDIPLERIDMIPWGVQEPPVDSSAAPLVGGDYICAVGSQARDYAGLIEAMRGLPEIPLVLVACPENLRRISIPDNVTVFRNIPLADVYNIVRHSRFMVLPLLHSEVPCGHVTLVTAMYLGKAVLATESAGITDYVQSEQTGILFPSGNPRELTAKIRALWNDSPLCAQLGAAGRQYALAHFTEQTTVDYVRNILERFDTTGAL